MSTALQFNGRVALVTGAGAGIGRASARAFAAAGAAVAVVDIDAGLGEETVTLIRQTGGTAARFFPCDVSDEQQVAGLVRAVADTYGRLDFAHNNAGISPVTGNTANCPKALWDRIIAVNLTGVWLGMKYEIPAMIAAGGGAIVNTSSGVGLKAFPNQPAYVASKHGVVGLTKTAALEFATAGIRVNAICPGATLTPMVETKARAGAYTIEGMASMCPMKRIADPDEIAQVAVWLCSAGASFVNGAILPVDGGILAG
ncbi:MAG: putative oxidoreductase, family [Deltaproteobacteria bacterium]|jgi:NAD(P)-dependent dehydrogenase (short-subunit alcohol dehydrogenase family)|nr:putative oxidoreductase, family [Deltaproteobacteria bacterium]